MNKRPINPNNYLQFDSSTVFKCLEGEQKGKYFVSFHGSYRLIENGRINRYPYYNMEHDTMLVTGYKVDGKYNLNIEVDYEHLGTSQNVDMIKKAMAIAMRMIKHDNRDMYTIELTKYKETKYGYVEQLTICNTNWGLSQIKIGELTIVGDDIYVYHDASHEERRGRIYHTKKSALEKFDHKVYGMLYKKDIPMDEVSTFDFKI